MNHKIHSGAFFVLIFVTPLCAILPTEDYLSILPKELIFIIIEFGSKKEFGRLKSTSTKYKKLIRIKKVPSICWDFYCSKIPAREKNYINAPLVWAATENHLKQLSILLRYSRCNVNATDRWGKFTSLHQASKNGNLRVVKLLLKHKANPNLADIWGCTPLYEAVLLGYTKIVKLLIDYNANPALASHPEISPLYVATIGGHAEIVNLLLATNKLTIKDCVEVWFLARKRGDKEIENTLNTYIENHKSYI